MHRVLVLARPTEGDLKFYKRWEAFGPVTKRCIEKDPENYTYTILVVDFRFTFDKNHKSQTKIYLDINDFQGAKYVCSATTGEDHLNALPTKIKTTTLKGETEFLEYITSVAEFTIQMMLCLSRPIDGMGVVMRNKTVGIIGLGRIGKHVLERVTAFKMHPLSWDQGDSLSKLENLLKESDYVTIHLALNDQTRKFLRAYHFSLMKPGPSFTIPPRGGLVNKAALAHALNQGLIAAAAVDVVDDPEILNQEKVSNLIVTPHIAGSTVEDRIATDEFIVIKLKRLLYAN